MTSSTAEDVGPFFRASRVCALPTDHGVFVGPSDLSLSRGRGAYAKTEADVDDLRRIAAAEAAGKP